MNRAEIYPYNGGEIELLQSCFNKDVTYLSSWKSLASLTGEHFECLNKNHIQFVCRGKQRTKVADPVCEIPVEEDVEGILASPKEYQPKTERGKRDVRKEPVKIAERMVDVTNCEKRLRAIAVKHMDKKCIDLWLTNIPASLFSAKGGHRRVQKSVGR